MTLRILNAIFWIWLSLSNVPFPVGSEGSEFWLPKATQLFEVNQYLLSDPALFAIRSVVTLVLWFLIGRSLSRHPIRR